MGLVKTRRLAAMHKQQRAKAGMKLPAKKGACALPPHLYKSGGRPAAEGPQVRYLRSKISTANP